MPGNQVGGDLIASGLAAFKQEAAGSCRQSQRCGVGFWMVVSDVRLLNARWMRRCSLARETKHGGRLRIAAPLPPFSSAGGLNKLPSEI